MHDSTKVTKNYGDYGGNDWWVEGSLHVTGDIDIAGDKFAPAANLSDSATVAQLIAAMKLSGLIERDSWIIDAEAVGTPAAMPTAETAANSAHVTTYDVTDGVLTLTLDCKVSELEDADHGETWGVHKWLGFAVDSGLASIEGIVFTDATGASATLGAGDISEATALGIDAGGFVLYIKAEDLRYLHDGRAFTLEYPRFKKGIFTIKIVEPEEDDT